MKTDKHSVSQCRRVLATVVASILLMLCLSACLTDPVDRTGQLCGEAGTALTELPNGMFECEK